MWKKLQKFPLCKEYRNVRKILAFEVTKILLGGSAKN